MPEIMVLFLAACMFAGAALYTSVGHAGASAYIALMALFGLAPAVMRPTALALNILVASFTSFRYLHAGLFRWRTLWPFLIGALPFAVVGGAVQLPGQFYRPLVGVILIIAGIRFLWPKELTTNQEPRDPPKIAAVAFGALVGLLSGLTGTGGGIFLSYAPTAIVELARLALKAKSETARIAAIRELLDRGYGRPRQAMEFSAPAGDPLELLLEELDALSRKTDRYKQYPKHPA